MNVQDQCESYFEDLQAYLDNELPAAERRRLAEHIAACESCRATLDDLKAVSGALGAWEAPEPTGLPSAREILGRAGAPPEPVRPELGWTPARRWAAAAAAVVMTAGIGFVLMRSVEPGGRDVAQAPPSPVSEPAQPKLGDRVAVNAASGESETPTTTNTATAATAPAGEKKPAPTGAATPAPPPAPETAGDVGKASEPAAIVPEEDEAKQMLPGSTATVVEPPEPVAQQPAAPAADAEANATAPARRQKAAAPAGPTRAAVIQIDARSVEKVPERVGSTAAAAGGRVQSRSMADSGTERTTRLVIAVPEERLEWTMRELRGLGRVRGERSGVAEADRLAEGRESGRRSNSGLVTIEVVVVERDQ